MTAIFDKLPPGIFGLPLDLLVGEDWEQSSVPAVWHLTRSLWDVIWGKGWTGLGERMAILDTGCNPHVLLPRPIAERSFVPGQRPTDNVSGHGTHCAGTALGRGGIGVAPEAELINVKVLSDQGSGSSTGIAQGIRWAVDEGATIISMSLGSSSPHRPTQEAMQYAAEMWRGGRFRRRQFRSASAEQHHRLSGSVLGVGLHRRQAAKRPDCQLLKCRP
jgi:subtilisin family serine protease